MTESDQLDLSALPYADRHLVMVQPDEVVAAARKAREAEKTKADVPWTKVLAMILGVPLGAPFAVTSAAAILIAESYEAFKKARESGLNVLQISNSEATQLDMPLGHPRPGTLYVAHPSTPLVYYTAASFHRLLFEHKLAEAIELVMSLGAKRLEVQHVRGWSRDFAATLNVPMPAANVGASTSSKESLSSSILYNANLDNNVTPGLPPALVWYKHEPTWASIAQGRLKYGLKEFSLVVSYEDDFGVHAGLKVTASKAGVDLGGSFQDHVSTCWKISGTFN